jgi:hypothetical protein
VLVHDAAVLHADGVHVGGGPKPLALEGRHRCGDLDGSSEGKGLRVRPVVRSGVDCLGGGGGGDGLVVV